MNKPKIVVLDGFILNPGDISWGEIESISDLTVYDRLDYDDVIDAASLQQQPEQWLGLGHQPAASATPPRIHSPAAGFCFETLGWWKWWGVWKQLHH